MCLKKMPKITLNQLKMMKITLQQLKMMKITLQQLKIMMRYKKKRPARAERREGGSSSISG